MGICFISGYNKAVCASDGDMILVANRDSLLSWEHFFVEPVGTDKFGLFTAHKKYVCAEDTGILIGNRGRLQSWETFKIVHLPDGWIAIQTAHNTYWSANDDGTMNVRSRNIGNNERFRLIDDPSKFTDKLTSVGQLSQAEKVLITGAIAAGARKIGEYCMRKPGTCDRIIREFTDFISRPRETHEYKDHLNPSFLAR
jgi:hypothetical protein